MSENKESNDVMGGLAVLFKLITGIVMIILAISLLSCQTVNAQVTKDVDDFDGTTTIYTPLSSPVALYKTIDGGESSNYLLLKTNSGHLTVEGTGAWVIFEDGTKWANTSVEVDVDAADSYGYDYKVMTSLSEKDLELFATKKVKKFKLYVFDEELSAVNAEKYRGYIAEAVAMK